MNNYNVIYIIKYSCIDAISIFNNPGAISSSLSQIDKYYDGYSRVFPRNNKVWAHGPMSLKFDGPFL